MRNSDESNASRPEAGDTARRMDPTRRIALIRLALDHRAGPGLVLLAASTLAATIACQAPPPPPEGEPSPVYAWPERHHESADPVETHWRFVPLSPTPKPFPTEEEFLELTARCEAQAENRESRDADQAGRRRALQLCLGDQGFYRSLCSDGVDNDDDGQIDFGADPGCAEAHALSESPECDDDRDNDGDGLADWDGGGFTHPDPECLDTPAGTREAEPRKRRSLNPF